jgi:cysteinyl-tRNA synthetase
VITPEIEKLIEQREQARAAKDWARTDFFTSPIV